MNKSALLFFLCSLLYSVAHSCDCDQPAVPLEAMKQSKTVFLGRVVSGEVANEKEGRFEFEIKETFKGARTEKAVIYAPLDHSQDCGYHFIIGLEYLVYAHGDRLVTNNCTRTTVYNHSMEVEKELKELRTNKRGS